MRGVEEVRVFRGFLVVVEELKRGRETKRDI